MQRYFIKEEQIENKTVTITGSDYHHIKNVMRMREKERIVVCPNNGKAYLAEIGNFVDKSVEALIIEELTENREMKVRVTVAMGYTKAAKQDEVVRRLAELGTDSFLPIFMQRSIAKATENQAHKTARLMKIAKEACEQSQRQRLMRIFPPVAFSDFIATSANYGLLLYAYEEKRHDKSLKSILSEFTGNSIIVLVGPEGGISREEAERLDRSGFRAVGLGPRILRTETAPLYIMSVLAYSTEL